MSWLYTLIIAGLAFSSDAGSSPVVSSPDVVAPVAEQAVYDETERFDKTYPFNPNGKVNLNNLNGSIVLEAWDRNEIRVEYTKTVDQKERLDQARVKIDARPDQMNIGTEFVGWNDTVEDGKTHVFGKLQIDFRLTIPRTAYLNSIEAVNGNVTLSKFTNFVRVSAVNGQVIATNLRGTAKLSTVGGEVRANLDKLEPGSQIELSTVNGSVNLIIPSDSSAVIRADTLNGPIASDLGLPVKHGKFIGHNLYGRIGNGEVPIKLNSVNGSLNITRRSDGRPATPVTNLLNVKDGEDEESLSDPIAEIASEKYNKQAEKAIKDAQKAMDENIKAATKEVDKIRPETADLTKKSVDMATNSVADAAKLFDADEFKRQLGQATGAWPMLAGSANWDFGLGVPRVDESSGSFAVKGAPKVIIDAPGCSVSVRGWDRPDVQYRAIQDSRARVAVPVIVSTSHTDTAVGLKIEGSSTKPGYGLFNQTGETRIEVFVPAKSDVKIGATREIRVEGVSGYVEANGADSPVNVRDSSGTLRVSSREGRVRVIGFRGDVNTNTSEGDISLEGVFSSIVARSADGRVTLTLPQDANADLESNCSDITGNGLRVEKITNGSEITRYRLGSGGAKFQVWTTGSVEIRGADTLKAGS